MNILSQGILIVDDNPILLTVVSEILKQNGLHVRSASDGFGALAEMRAQIPEILLSELNMAGMSGFELLSVVRRRFPTVFVIAMSGAYLGEAVPAGVAADAFYAKGASGVERLLLLMSTSQVVSQRREVPMWLPSLPASCADPQAILASCPECLRPFSFLTLGAGTEQEATCSHCAQHLRVAFVRQSEAPTEHCPLAPLRHLGRATITLALMLVSRSRW